MRKKRSETPRSKPRPSRSGAAPQPSVTPRRYWPLLFKCSLVLAVTGGILLAYLDATIRAKFEGKRWALPAQVYARPLELYSGQALSRDALQLELHNLGYQFVADPHQPGTARLSSGGVELYSRGFHFNDGVEPPQRLRIRFAGRQVLQIVDANGRELPLVRLEPVLIGGIYPADNEDRELVALAKVPTQLIQALLAVEDQNFYQHLGLSFKGIARAAWSNLRAGGVVQGGSTLTQQLIKNFFLTSERTIWRKLLEVPMALLLELHYSKDEILEAYFNEVYLGQDGSRAIHGFGLASHYYFGRPLDSLSLEQLALLAGLVKGPSYYDPRRYPARATERRDLVLALLQQQNQISADQRDHAQRQGLGVVASSSLSKGAFPAYLDLVKRQLRREYRQEDLASEGLQVFTNLDPILQRRAEQSLVGTIDDLSRRHGTRLDGLQGALVLSNSQTGELLALVGGREPRFQGFNRAIDAIRPIGSLVKPAVYLTALAQPARYTLSSLIDDSPLSIANQDGSYWQPKNYDRKSHGPVTLHYALAHSLNLATARLGLELGMDKVVETLRRLGVERAVDPYPSTLLGALSLSPLEVMQIYQTIAANGFGTPLRAIRSVHTADGILLSRYPFEVDQRFDPAAMHLLQYALQETVREGTARGLYRHLPSDLNMAGKTGTTNDQRDSWFAGFTGDFLAVAWLGQDDNRPTPLTGSSGALKVWGDLMQSIATRSYQMSPPSSIEYHWVDEAQMLRTDETCPGARLVPYIAGTAPTAYSQCGAVDIIEPPVNWFRRLFGD